jgi:diaminohydroxyphosphoribosylaminopyrimidine deaminase / 5-amino-6-(5-phosphoribosylamino)uracil reductase
VGQFTPFDHHMMGIALMIARQGLGRTAPNPSVGSVLVDPASGEILGRGRTADGGRPHGEVVAIGRAGGPARTRGATLYVTLEPCSHTGQTGPCTQAIIAAGIARVVCATEDPDPRVGGQGLEQLREAGIAVSRGLRGDEARWIARGHIVRVTERRPFVTVKIAVGANGLVPQGAHGRPAFVTGPQARAHGHLLRAQADAILVGAGTIRADDPELTCRLPGMADRSPVRVVLAGRKAVLAGRIGAALIYGPAVGHGEHGQRVTIAEVGGRLWLPAVMEDLVARDITRVLVEGGPRVWRSFGDAALVDEVALYCAGGGDEAHARAVLERQLGDLPLTLYETRALGPDTLYRLRRPSP